MGRVNKERNSNYELLRVIVMVMIIGLHQLGPFGKTLGSIEKWSPNFYIAVFLESFFIIAVNCFIFITGYFNITKKEVKLNKIINLAGLTIFYYVMLYFIGIILGDVTLSVKSLVFTIMPFMKGAVWFVNTYIILVILSPYINKFLLSLTKLEYKKLLIIEIVIFSIVPTFLPLKNNNDNGYGIVTFVVIYSIAAYIRLNIKAFKNKYNYLLKWFMSSFTVFMLSLLSYKLINGSNAWGYNNIFNILSAMYIFLFFMQIKIQSRVINYMAKFSFTTYIIHTNPSITKFIYEDVLKRYNYGSDNSVLVYTLISIIVVLVICIVIELIRRVLVKIIFNSYVKRKLRVLEEKYNLGEVLVGKV